MNYKNEISISIECDQPFVSISFKVCSKVKVTRVHKNIKKKCFSVSFACLDNIFVVGGMLGRA